MSLVPQTKKGLQTVETVLQARHTLKFEACYALIALTGQVSTQAPQSMQVSAAITLLSPASLIELTGQESSHAPQLMHSSVMVCAKVIHLLLFRFS